MTKVIVGRFPAYQMALDAVDELVNNGVDKDRMNLISPNYVPPEAGGVRPEAAERTKEVAGIGALAVTGATTVALFGLGLTLLVGPLAALINTQGSGMDAEDVQHAQFEQLLIDAGIATSGSEARGYINDVLAGSSLLAVEVGDEQRDLATEVFHRYGGTGLVYRNVTEEADAGRTV